MLIAAPQRPSPRVLIPAGLFIAVCSGCASGTAGGITQQLNRIENRRLAELGQAWRSSSTSEQATSSFGLGITRQTSDLFDGHLAVVLAALEPEVDEDESTVAEQAEAVTEDGPLPSLRDTLRRDLKQFPKSLWNNTVAVSTDPLNLVILAGAAGTSIALHQDIDERNADFFEDENHFGAEWRDVLSVAGNPGTHFALAGLWYTVGAIREDHETYEVGRNLIDALVLNGLSTLALKVVSNRERPNGDELSFPSGNVSSTVALATVMHDAYGPWVGVPLYGVSALVAMQRLDDRKHWVSDVTFGAALGFVIGHTVATGERPELFGGHLAPYADPDTQFSGIAWVKHF